MFYKDNENVTSIPFEEYNKQSNEAENKEQEIEIYFDNLDKNISRQQAQQDNAIVNSTEAENNELFHDTEIEDNDESLNDPNDTREEDMNIEATSNDPEERRTYNLRDRSQIDLPKNFEDYVMAVMDIMQRGSGQEVNNLQEGAAVGVWIIRKSKTYPGHNYYFNTLTGAAVWNLSEQEIANAMRMPNINRFDNHAEPREKPPMMNFNPARKVNRSGINRGKTFLNRYHKTWSKQDLRKKISKHVNYNKNYLNTSRLPFSEGFINDTKFTQAGTIEDEENYETMSLIENEEDSVSKLDCTPLKNLGKPSVHKSCWYLLVDTNVLIHNFNYLNNLTSTDPTCCFLVPHCVFDELTSYAEKEQDATAGRVLRFLFDFAYIGIEELEIESEYESTTDVLRKIYNVYVNIEKDNYHAVLISDDKNLLKYKGVIHVFSMAEVKNMVSVYVSHQTSAPSSSISDRVVIINKNHDFHTTMDSNHTASNGKRSFSESQKEDNLRKVSLPSKSIKTHICTELMKKKCQLKSFNDISITIVNTDNRINTIESADEVSIEQNCFNDTTKTSTLIEECTPRMVEKKNVIRLNRNKLPPYNNNTTETPIVGTGKKKFRWRKRRNNFRISGSEDNIVSSIDDNERRVENTGSLECEKETSENTSKNPSKEKKSKDLDTNESSNSCIAFKNSSSNSESLDRRKDIIENEVANSDNKNQLKDLECDESSNSCTFVKKFIGDCIVIDDSSTSEIISNSESNVNSTHVLNIQKTPKLFRRFKNSNKNLLNNIMFTVTSKAMEENIKMKCDEWVSRFVQIMEDVLAQILRQESVIERIALPPPWSLQEAVQCIIKEFYSHCFVVDSANKLSIISKEIENTKSITNIHPEDFMEMYSYGVNLVDALKDVQPNEDLNIASKSLSDLLHDIEFGQNDSFVDEVVPEDKGETTLIPDIPLKDIVHSVSGIKVQNNENPEKCASPSSKTTSVVRNSSPAKKIKEDVMVTFIAELSESNTADAEIDHRVTNTRRLTQETNNSNEVNGLIENNKHDSIIEPKIVRCFTKFPQFEERINNSYRTLMDIYSTDSDIFYEEDNYEATNCSMGDEDITDLYETPNTRTYFANVQKNKIQVDLFLKKFLIYVKNVLTRAREFCKRCVLYLNKQGSAIADMRLQVNTEKVHSEVISIYYNLSSILSRGNGDENINYLLKNSGCECEEFSEQYWNTIKKCREQASAVLKIVEHITMALKR
ncbi:hypothetical protein K1T71_006651 [Dendrolimus kikuchii]|uniref:Uncharacterized protein n=1 Tax=Dendrolimus kikuchii TaxID=765133 RepID=A0ACC1D2G4_9NEOP|nr:hypothetical protein K1T71_006651 [Dendrolimus kikuchii]